MSYIDIGLIAFVVLFGALGVWKGVQKSAVALGAFIVSFVIAFFLANVIAEALLGIDSIREFVIGTTGDWSLYKMIDAGMSDAPWLGKAFTSEHFYKPIYDIVKTNKDIIANGTYHEGVALSAAFSLFSMIVGVGLFIVVRALLCIVTMIIKSYIPKKKSVGNRVGGLFVGIARGGIWAFVISIIFSTMGGLTFMSGFDSIEQNYESAVMANYLYEGAYGIKNSMFIPGEDMFSRLVFKSGLNKLKPYNPGDGGGDGDGEGDKNPLDAQRSELYTGILNLNYPNGNRYRYDKKTGQIIEDKSFEAWNAAAYKNTGFDGVITAIVNYNDRMAASIWRLDDGALPKTVSADVIQEYIGVREKIYGFMYGPTGFSTALLNYLRVISDKDFGLHDNQGDVDSINEELAEYYDTMLDALDGMKEEYAKFELFIKDPNVGSLTLPVYPAKIEDKVFTPPTELEQALGELNVELKNLNYGGKRYTYNKATGKVSENNGVAAWDASVYEKSGFDAVLEKLFAYNDKLAELVLKEGGPLSAQEAAAVNEYIGYVESIYEALFADDNGLRAKLDAYMAIINDEDFGNRVDQGEVDEVNAALDSLYTDITGILNGLKGDDGLYSKLGLLVADGDGGALDLGEYPEKKQDEALAQPTAHEQALGELNVGLKNLGYGGERYSYDKATGRVSENNEVAAWDASAYEKSGFHTVIEAILAYNDKLAELVLKEGGPLSSDELTETVNAYIGYLNDIRNALFAEESGLRAKLDAYMAIINGEDFGNGESQAELDSLYSDIIAALDGIKSEYAKLELLVADGDGGGLELPDYPEEVKDE
ncbi:MAG: hypothetical protein J1G38_02845 [Clostridiales bacterium]|nr:hypothetical protein [Clostridiales bacterium]